MKTKAATKSKSPKLNKLASDYYALCTEMLDLEKKKKALRQSLIDHAGASVIETADYAIVRSESKRESVDTDFLKAYCKKQGIKYSRFVNVTEFTTLTVKPSVKFDEE